MYTLIPESEIKNLRKEYRKRALTVFFFGITISILIGICALAPSYILSFAEEKEAIRQLNEIQKSRSEGETEQVENIAKEANDLITRIGDMKDSPIYSTVIEKIVKERSSAVSLTSFTLTSQGTTTVEVVVRGVADTRDALVSFKRRLEQDPSTSSVDLPVSDLAKSKDIIFAIKLVTTF